MVPAKPRGACNPGRDSRRGLRDARDSMKGTAAAWRRADNLRRYVAVCHSHRLVVGQVDFVPIQHRHSQLADAKTRVPPKTKTTSGNRGDWPLAGRRLRIFMTTIRRYNAQRRTMPVSTSKTRRAVPTALPISRQNVHPRLNWSDGQRGVGLPASDKSSHRLLETNDARMGTMTEQSIRETEKELVMKRRATGWFQTAHLGPFLIVLLAATLVRVGLVIHLIAKSPGSSYTQPFDAAEMGNIATNIAEGRGFSSPFGRGSQPTAWECPIVPYLYAGFIKIAGGPTGHVANLIYLLQAVVGGIAAALYWLFSQMLMFRRPGLFSEWLTSVLAILVCLWPESVYSVTYPWYYVWQDAGLVAFALLAIRWWDRMDFVRGVQVGVAGGILALINVTPLPIIAFVFIFPALKKRLEWSVIRAISVAAISFLVVVAPWLVRNAVVFQTIVPLRSNTGFQIFEGNNAVECIREQSGAPHPATDKQEFERYATLGEIGYSKQALGRAADYIEHHPGQTVVRTVARIYVSWLTDLTDRWVPRAGHEWWKMGRRSIVRYLVSSLLILASAGILVWGSFFGRFRLLPYAPLFAAILLILPFPHYFTLADPEYTATFRMWLGVTAVCLLALRSSAPIRPLEISK